MLDNFRPRIALSIPLLGRFTVPRRPIQCTTEADSLCPRVGTQRITFIFLFFYHSHLKRVQTDKVTLPQFNTQYPFLHMQQKAIIPLERDERKSKKHFL